MNMSKKLSDSLPFYLGCKCYSSNKNATKGTVYRIKMVGSFGCEIYSEAEERLLRVSANEIKLFLRPLSDMTEEEDKEFQATKVFQRATPVHVVGSMHWTAESFRWLLSKHFDLFNLITEGIAIEKKLSNHE